MDRFKIKFPVSQIHTMESNGTNKTEYLKENIPPEVFYACDQNAFPDGIQQLVKATPKKCKKELIEDPLTPNTNFKLLASLAAALDYANCATPKSRKPLIDVNSEPSQKETTRTARKEKSLSIICTRFLSMHPLYPTIEQKCIISLDEVCFKLGIERRRLYDIVNVFESINMLNKLSKNKYLWFGKNKLMSSLLSIKAAAKKENILLKLQYVLDLEESKPESKPSRILDDVAVFHKQLEKESPSSLSSDMLQYSNFPELRKEKSLAFMSQRFLMLFLVSPAKIISLSAAAKVLNGFQKNDGGAQMKTQIRRLYDIANVLSSIGLIQKAVTIGNNGRKPAFKYIGPALNDQMNPTNHPESTPKKTNEKSRSLTRHSSFQEICAVAEIEHRKLCLDETPNSAPPFDNNLLSKKQTYVTNFSNLNFSMCHKTTKTKMSKKCMEEKDTKEKGQCLNGSPNKSHCENDAQPLSKAIMMPLQSKVSLMPETVFTSNGCFYVLSPVSYELRETKQTGTYLLCPPGLSDTQVIEEKASKNEVVNSQLRALQRNPGLKPHSDASQTKDTLQAVPSDYNLQRFQFFTGNKDVNPVLNRQMSQIQPNKDISSNDMESNDSSLCSTRNSSSMSSIFRFDSPFSIPSGYATPIPNISPDASFPSFAETSTFLKTIENCVDSIVSLTVPENVAFTSEGRSDIGHLTNYSMEQDKNASVLNASVSNKHDVHKKCGLSSCNSNFPLKEAQTFSISNNGSSDSLNFEVSEILKGKKLGEFNNKKHLSIDENTIMSPIKKHKMETIPPNVTPSAFIASPYIPDKIFVINSTNYQSTSMNTTPKPFELK